LDREYSHKEIELFKHFNCLDLALQPHISVFHVYERCILHAFLENDTSSYAIALRKCYIQFTKGTFYRLTEKWDALLDF